VGADRHDHAPLNDGSLTREELREFFHLLVEGTLKMDAAFTKLSESVTAQTVLIDKLIAEKNATGDADAATIQAALDANNTKITAALTAPAAAAPAA
jgi:cyanate lyase